MALYSPKLRVLVVCMGNICRSPTAEGVLRQALRAQGLDTAVEVDSAGTHGYHVGEAPDGRTQRAAARRGIDLSMLRARRVDVADFERFDLILAMDEGNLARLQAMCPLQHQAKLELFLRYGSRGEREVPDPYYGGEDGFERVLDLVQDAAEGLVENMRRRLKACE